MSLASVTITGADDGVRVQDLVDLSREFPFVEWGILYSESRQGTPRYPGYEWRQALAVAPPMRLSLHLCGRAARELTEGLWTYVHGPHFQRLQVNGYTPPAPKLRAAAHAHFVEVILQVRSEAELVGAAEDARLMPYASILFDPSGGRGIEPFRWPVRPLGVKFGYAGGIGPSNVEEVISAIGPVEPYWIDMESGVRTEDRFDLVKVRDVLSRVASYTRDIKGGS
jgi:N-(5'phosphoribosyl)anthranilate (PRA) isomerase